jgi:hypothetical protein
MPCDTRLKPRQTISQRKAEVVKAVDKLSQGLATGKVKAKIGPQGAIAFIGFDEDRDGVTDACAYRRLMVSGSALAKAAIAKAELLAGRKVDKSVLAAGVHSHDGGDHWHHGH